MSLSLDDIGYDVYYQIIIAIFLFAMFIVNKILSKYFQESTSLIKISTRKNRSKKLWIKLLKENKQIDDYLLQFNQIKKNENLKGSNSSTLIAGGIAMVLFFIFANIFNPMVDFWNSMALISLFLNIIPFIITIASMRYMYSKSKNTDQIYNKASIIVNYIDSTKFYIFLSNGLLLVTTFLLYNILEISLPITNVMGIFEMSFALAIVSYYYLILARRDFIYFIKNAINTEILNKCPRIMVTTNERKIEGNIKDIFDDEVIVLDDNERINIAKWVDIVCIFIPK